MRMSRIFQSVNLWVVEGRGNGEGDQDASKCAIWGVIVVLVTWGGGGGSCDVYKDLFLHTRRDGNEDRAGRS